MVREWLGFSGRAVPVKTLPGKVTGEECEQSSVRQVERDRRRVAGLLTPAAAVEV
jgi:hypothetical protein